MYILYQNLFILQVFYFSKIDFADITAIINKNIDFFLFCFYKVGRKPRGIHFGMPLNNQ